MPPVKVFAQKKPLTLTPGQVITLSAQVTAAAYQWYKDGKAIPGAVKPTFLTNEPGAYTVEAFNVNSCASPMSDAINVLMADPIADLAVVKKSESKPVHPGDPFVYQLTVTNKGPVKATDVQLKDPLPEGLEYWASNTTQGSSQYDYDSKVITWQIGAMEVNGTAQMQLTVKPTQTGTVTNTANVVGAGQDPDMTNNHSSDTKQILGLNIPNVFTPNGDGNNDTFEIPHLDNYEENEIVIVNRWGNNIYQKKNYKNEWTGEGLTEGTYFYLLKVKNKRGEWETYKGYLTLLRSKQMN